MRTLAFLKPKEVESIAWKALSESGLPKPRELRVEEKEDSSGGDIIIIGLLVAERDDLGTSQQRLEAGGKIQSAVWESGDSRSAIMQHFPWLETPLSPKKFAL